MLKNGKRSWTQKKRVMANNPKQKPLSTNEFTDLNDKSDYDALQQEVRATSHRRKSGETIDEMVLSIDTSVRWRAIFLLDIMKLMTLTAQREMDER